MRVIKTLALAHSWFNSYAPNSYLYFILRNPMFYFLNNAVIAREYTCSNASVSSVFVLTFNRSRWSVSYNFLQSQNT